MLNINNYIFQYNGWCERFDFGSVRDDEDWLLDTHGSVNWVPSTSCKRRSIASIKLFLALALWNSNRSCLVRTSLTPTVFLCNNWDMSHEGRKELELCQFIRQDVYSFFDLMALLGAGLQRVSLFFLEFFSTSARALMVFFIMRTLCDSFGWEQWDRT